ncbi:hypothetical protein Bca101_081545 [Brassica carinata]
MKRGGKDEEEEKIVEPMFPRLHVKDAADKGGPRAPPRNKMALYEQLSIPSHRFTDSLPRHTNTFCPPPPAPSNQPCGVERNLTSQHLDGRSTQMTSFLTTLPHRRTRDQRRKTVREEDDFAVPVYTNDNTSTRLGRTKTVKEKRNRTDLEKSASGCERVNDSTSNASLRQESRSSRLELDQDGGDETTGVMETDDGVESHGGNPGEYCTTGRFDDSMQHIINGEACDDDDDLMVDSSVSSVDVSPDEVVGVLGQKRFWKARKAIANQQRIFAVQLFELHRLIKVQRLIASSSDVLLDESSYLGKVAAKSFPVKKLLPTEFIVKPPPLQKHRSSDSEKTGQHKMTECSAENVVVGKSSNQPSNYTPFATNPPPAVNGCYYPPPPSGGNQQWLIPVMSPSEGLIYKPHPGPGGPPVCGGYYGHFMPAPMIMGSFMGGGGGSPPFHPGVGFPSPANGYFPPYGIMPTMMNPYGPGQQQQQQQPNEQMNQFVHPGNLQYASAVNTQQPSSVNEEISQQHQPTIPRARKSRQRSTGSSSPSGTNSFRALSVVDHDDDNNEPNGEMMTTTTTTTRTTVTQTTRDGGGVTRVIKVVPHNAKLASENAARIFRSIQEERKHYDSFSNLP